MPCKAFFAILLISVTGALAATSDLILGLDYGEWAPANIELIRSDNSGALYILTPCATSWDGPSCVTKLSPQGQSVLWRSELGFTAGGMAVDPAGDVFVVPAPGSSSHVFVEKLTLDGAGVAWQQQFGYGQVGDQVVSVAVDALGRPVVAWSTNVVRLTAAGAIDRRATAGGAITGLAVNAPGTAIAARTSNIDFALIALDAGTKVPVSLPQDANWPTFAVDPDGGLIAAGLDVDRRLLLQRVDASGVLQPAVAVGHSTPADYFALAVDSSGNIYLTGVSGPFAMRVRNSLAPCGSAWLSVFSPDGTLLQTTYLPGASEDINLPQLLTVGADGSVFLSVPAVAGFSPPQAGPFAAADNSWLLFRLSPHADAPVMPLACVGNSASFATGPVAPGEIVSLFGNGLGPGAGVQTTASLEAPFPTEAGGVEVTFDGKPAPLLWVQDSQINAAVPWSVSGKSTQICVTFNEHRTNCLRLPVAETAPGVFITDGWHAAALNEDGTVNSAANPAKFGSVVSVFATGMGPITPAQADGSLVGFPLPLNVVTSRVFSRPCVGLFCELTVEFPVTYGGPAPLLIAGLTQVSFRLEEGGGYNYVTAASSFSNYFGLYVTAQ